MLIEVFFISLLDHRQLRWRLRNPISVRLVTPAARLLTLTCVLQLLYWIPDQDGTEDTERTEDGRRV
jgi:hypothetical protein